MNILIILLIYYLTLFTSTLQSYSNVSCRANMFRLVNDGFGIVNVKRHFRLSIQLLNASSYFEDYTLKDCIDSCLKHIFFRAISPENHPKTQFTETWSFNKINAKFSDHIDYTLMAPYQPYSTYNFEIGYVQNEPYSNEVTAYRLIMVNCFGAPSFFDYETTAFPNGSYLIEWTEPTEINAPHICYYQFDIKYESTNERNVRRVTERKFFLEKLNASAKIRIRAVNDHTCYVNEHSRYPSCNLNLASRSRSFKINPIQFNNCGLYSKVFELYYVYLTFALFYHV